MCSRQQACINLICWDHLVRAKRIWACDQRFTLFTSYPGCHGNVKTRSRQEWKCNGQPGKRILVSFLRLDIWKIHEHFNFKGLTCWCPDLAKKVVISPIVTLDKLGEPASITVSALVSLLNSIDSTTTDSSNTGVLITDCLGVCGEKRTFTKKVYWGT